MTSVHFCVRWCFVSKGQCHKIFCFRFFHESSSLKPLNISKFVDLQIFLHFHLFSNLRICDLRTQYFSRFADLRFVDTGSKYATNVNGGAPWAANISAKFRTNLKRPEWDGYSGAWKKPEVKNLLVLSLYLSLTCTKLYKEKTADSRCHSLPTGNYIPESKTREINSRNRVWNWLGKLHRLSGRYLVPSPHN